MIHRSVVAGVIWAALASLAGAQPLSLRIPDETIAPGGVLQAKLELTEPRPIQSGGGGMSFDRYDEFLGLAVHSPSGDAAAIGVMRGATLKLRFVSPTDDLGSAGEYPLITTTLKVPAGALVGARSPITMGTARFTGPGGVPYAFDIKPGIATVGPAGSAAIIDVSPGSAVVPAGAPIVISGLGFEPGTRVRLKEASVTNVQFVDSKVLIVTPGQAVDMHGQEVEIEIPSTRQRIVYYAYQRTQPLGRSAHPLLAAVEPAFPKARWTAADVRYVARTANDVYGLALQNDTTTPSQVALTLRQSGGAVGPLRFMLPANARVVRSLAEVFGVGCDAGCSVLVEAGQAIHVMGVAGDLAADEASPLLPVTPQSTVLDVAPLMNASAFRVGDPFVLSVALTPGPVPVAADLYVVLQTPTGEYWSLTPAGVRVGVFPLGRRTVDAAASVELARLPLPGGLAFGAYTWYTALAAPGTFTLLTPIRTTAFTIAP